MKSTSVGVNWLLLLLAFVSALGNLYYFVKLTNKELVSITKATIEEAIPKRPVGARTSGYMIPTPKSAVLKTNYGEIEIAFRDKEAQLAVANFAKLAEGGLYDGTKFHRVIEGFMIQGGDPLSTDNTLKNVWGTGGPGFTFKDEFYPGDEMKQGSVAMANSGPNTNGSQFFIVTASAGTPWLVGHHTIFGRVTRGMDVVLKIDKVATEGKGVYDRPVKDVVLEKVTIK